VFDASWTLDDIALSLTVVDFVPISDGPSIAREAAVGRSLALDARKAYSPGNPHRGAAVGRFLPKSRSQYGKHPAGQHGSLHTGTDLGSVLAYGNLFLTATTRDGNLPAGAPTYTRPRMRKLPFPPTDEIFGRLELVRRNPTMSIRSCGRQ